MSRRRSLLPLFVLVSSVAAAAYSLCTSGWGWFGPAPDIFLVVIDTGRQDHMTTYGHHRSTSPGLASLERECLVYDNAYSTSGWTAPAHASIFTGLSPLTHGATQRDHRLSTQWSTLAEHLGEAGYQTIALVENPVVSAENVFSRGFSKFGELWRKPWNDVGVLPLFRIFIEEIASNEKPLFVFFNINIPHHPYDDAGEFTGLFLDDPHDRYARTRAADFFLERSSLSEADLERIASRYDEELRAADAVVAGIVEVLKSDARWDDCMFIVTSDHGEHFGEHGLVQHRFSLYEDVVRVPLYVHFPRRYPEGARIRTAVQLTDSFPTVAKAARLEGEDDSIHGEVLPWKEREDERALVLAYDFPVQAMELFTKAERQHPALAKYKRGLLAVIVGGKKLILGSDGAVELYDVEADPLERLDLASDPVHREEVLRLTTVLSQLGREYSAQGQPTADRPGLEPNRDRETRQALRALGYLAGSEKDQ